MARSGRGSPAGRTIMFPRAGPPGRATSDSKNLKLLNPLVGFMGMSAMAKDRPQAAGEIAARVLRSPSRSAKQTPRRTGLPKLQLSLAGPARTARSPAAPARAVAGSLREGWREAATRCFTERVMLAMLALCGMGAVAWAFLEVWLRLQNWPVFEAWVGRLWGA